jgi:lipopolysaccharide/colanic/teichoic acid biosynthesis glycosyltransferase
VNLATQTRELGATTQIVVTRHVPLQDRDWDVLEPQTFYARVVRTPLLYVLALVACLPALLIAIPIAIVNAILQGGCSHVFFRQDRIGRRGEAFTLLKFRTMRGTCGEGSDLQRVTRFGRWLRNTHLDELPQLWNILRGDMNLIGPRPEMISIERWAARHVPAFAERLVLRPGITGRAQITQGYTPDGDLAGYERKARINAEYLRSVSLPGDLRVLFSTAIWMLRRRGWITPRK